MNKIALSLLAVTILASAPACRKKKHVEVIEQDEITNVHEERVSGPEGWDLTEEDLK